MHKKESVIAPILERGLGLQCFTCEELNTDLLGTFSGEVERRESPVETTRQKCIQAMHITGCDLAVASEGSFGPHPVLGFVPCDEEILLLYDKKNEIEIVVKELSTKTNFDSSDLYTIEELSGFAKRVLFPSHGLILKNQHGHVVKKGIVTWDELEHQFHETLSRGGPVKAETDMRACFNPTRMSVIEAGAQKLTQAIQSKCPQCSRPGFVVNTAEPGLPCILCHLPTRSSLKHIQICQGCGFRNEILFPYQKQFEDPLYCDFCNP